MKRDLVNIARAVLTLGILTSNAWAWTPFIDILSPPSAPPGSGPLSLTISGANFIPGAIVNFNGVNLTPDSLTVNKLHVTVPAASLATAHTANVTVVNPDTAPLNGASNVAFFPITNATQSVSLVQETIPVTGAVRTLTGDFDGDGKQDIAAFYGRVLTVYLGDGAGGFNVGPATNLSGLFECHGAGFTIGQGDFNGDGKPDIALSDQCSTLEILLGDGTGAFTVAGKVDVASGQGFLAVGDFNGDGKLDLVLGTAFTIAGPAIEFFPGDGAGNLDQGSSILLPIDAYGFTVGDFNGDGILDISVSRVDPYGIFVLLGDGTGNFNFTSPSVPAGLFVVSAGDFDGDGKLDLVVMDQSGNIGVLLGDGSGGFSLASLIPVGGGFGVAVGDFNGDGNLDLALASSTAPNVTVLLGDGMGNLSMAASYTLPAQFALSLAAADFNGDGRIDFAFSGQKVDLGDDLSILLQTDPPDPPTDVTADFSITSTGLVYSRVTQLYHATITLTNTSGQTIAGPTELVFENLPTGVTLNAASGSSQGAPYLNIPGAIAPGQSVSITAQFSDPSNISITFTNKVYSGSLN